MTRVYLTTLPSAATDTAEDSVGAAIAQTGLLEAGGLSTEKVTTDSVDLRLRGRIQRGPTLSRKLADEIESLAESTYSSLPVFDPVDASLGRKRGYYEVADATVTPAQTKVDDIYEYDVRLTFAGSRTSDRRQVTTNPESVQTGLATGSEGVVGVPASATGVKWYTQADGTTDATVASTATAEYGDVNRISLTDAPADGASLLYDLPLDAEGRVDVRVYDDRGTSKFSTDVRGNDVSVWPHAYHTAFAFDGRPVIDNGLVRFIPDPDAGEFAAQDYNSTTDAWEDVALTPGDYALDDYDVRQVSPADVRVVCDIRDTTSGDRYPVPVRVQRGVGGVIVRQPANDVLPQGIEDWFAPIASGQTTDAQPEQGLKARDSVV